MKVINGILLGMLVLLMQGCASMFIPDSSLIDKVPVIKMGEAKPQGEDYILYIPKDTEFPVHFTLKGNLIAAPVDQKPATKINRDLYIYKYWASFDGRNWQPSHGLVSMPIGIGVGSEGGQVHVKVDLANN